MSNAFLRYLMHHGIKGQKWGVRRFQNYDGSLTDTGKKRYSHGKTTYQEGEYEKSCYEATRNKTLMDEVKKSVETDTEFVSAVKKFNDTNSKLNDTYQKEYDEYSKKGKWTGDGTEFGYYLEDTNPKYKKLSDDLYDQREAMITQAKRIVSDGKLDDIKEFGEFTDFFDDVPKYGYERTATVKEFVAVYSQMKDADSINPLLFIKTNRKK